MTTSAFLKSLTSFLLKLKLTKCILFPTKHNYKKELTFHNKQICIDITAAKSTNPHKHPNLKNPPLRFLLKISSQSPLTATEQKCLRHYLYHEGYLEEAKKYHEKVQNICSRNSL